MRAVFIRQLTGKRSKVKQNWGAPCELFFPLPFAFAFCLDYDAMVEKALIPK
jgi:hypothetical protein